MFRYRTMYGMCELENRIYTWDISIVSSLKQTRARTVVLVLEILIYLMKISIFVRIFLPQCTIWYVHWGIRKYFLRLRLNLLRFNYMEDVPTLYVWVTSNSAQISLCTGTWRTGFFLLLWLVTFTSGSTAIIKLVALAKCPLLFNWLILSSQLWIGLVSVDHISLQFH